LINFLQALSVEGRAQFADSSVGLNSSSTHESPSAVVAQEGSQGTSPANGGTPGAGQMRRWQRWTADETQALRDALTLLGTSNWTSIRDHMGTQRTVKQVCGVRALVLIISINDDGMLSSRITGTTSRKKNVTAS
jgi:hypothetical protein